FVMDLPCSFFDSILKSLFPSLSFTSKAKLPVEYTFTRESLMLTRQVAQVFPTMNWVGFSTVRVAVDGMLIRIAGASCARLGRVKRKANRKTNGRDDFINKRRVCINI